MTRQPLEVELTAARTAARNSGLGDVEPELLHLGNHTSVRLHPWPVVARIASGPSFDFSDGSLSRELALACHLEERGAPCVRPAANVPPGPYFESDCAISFWTFVEGVPVSRRSHEHMAARSLHLLHSALADVESDLPSFIDKFTCCETILRDPERAPKLPPEDRRFLQQLYRQLGKDLRRLRGRWQPIHGDPHLSNATITEAGPVWLDLESVCIGPVEWDIGFLPPATWSEFENVDIATIRLLALVRSFCVATWCWAEFSRTAATDEAAIIHLDKLRAAFPAKAPVKG